jgi:hypothetical protein
VKNSALLLLCYFVRKTNRPKYKDKKPKLAPKRKFLFLCGCFGGLCGPFFSAGSHNCTCLCAVLLWSPSPVGGRRLGCTSARGGKQHCEYFCRQYLWCRLASTGSVLTRYTTMKNQYLQWEGRIMRYTKITVQGEFCEPSFWEGLQ